MNPVRRFKYFNHPQFRLPSLRSLKSREEKRARAKQKRETETQRETEKKARQIDRQTDRQKVRHRGRQKESKSNENKILEFKWKGYELTNLTHLARL